MGLNWNEIKSRALLFRKTCGHACNEDRNKQRHANKQAAQCVLDARAQFNKSSLADLYDPLTMPPALLKAHPKLDTAVDAAYQPNGGKKTGATDAESVATIHCQTT